MIIGRRDLHREILPDIDLTALDTYNTVSRVHAEIKPTTAGCMIEDKGSMNGTFVNGRKLKPGQVVRLGDADEVGFGLLRFCFDGRKLRQTWRRV